MKKKLTFKKYLMKKDGVSKEFINKLLSYIATDGKEVQEHNGDCTGCPWTCYLCMFEQLLIDYRKYYFGNKK